MSERKPKNSDTRPKNLRSWSADSYIRSIKNTPEGHATRLRPEEKRGWNRQPECTLCLLSSETSRAKVQLLDPRRVRFRLSLQESSVPSFSEAEVSGCRWPMSSPSQSSPPSSPVRSSRPFSVLLWSKRKIHVSELMEDKCPFSPKSELAQCWHLIKKHGTKPALSIETKPKGPLLSSSPPTLISWEEISSSELLVWMTGIHLLHMGMLSAAPTLTTSWFQICFRSTTTPVIGGPGSFQAEQLLEGQPEGTFLLRDSAQDEYLFSVSFRRYSRSLHARIEQNGKRFSFDGRDPCMYRDPSVTGLLKHYSDPATCLFLSLFSRPLPRNFPFSLQHMCRAVICSCTTYQGIESLPLPYTLRHFLRQYHYRCNGACAV